jgi:sugar phosphate isomerase/epimerase
MWKGKPCSEWRPDRGGAGGGGGRGRGGAAQPDPNAPAAPVLTPEQQAAEAAKAREETLKWKREMSMDVFKELKKLYNDAGVSIYAVKTINANDTDEELEYVFTVAQTLGATHVTMELPPHNENSAAIFKRLGDWGLRKKIMVAYHTHAQGGMEVFDEAFAQSKGNFANVDFGHFVAGGNKGGTPLDFLDKFHDRIASFHLKDRTLPEHCSLNLPWGEGETPIKEILQKVQKNKWKMPATIELEYAVPAGSDKVKELQKCFAYCKAALGA